MRERLKKILQSFKKDDNSVKENTKSETSIKLSDLLNFSNNTDSIIHVEHLTLIANQNIYGSENKSENASSISDKLANIDALLEENKYKTAIEDYTSLLIDNAGSLEIDDKFLILNGLLCCYINLNDEINIIRYIEKVSDLGKVKEIHRFYFLCAVYNLNIGDSKKAYIEINKAIEIKADYFKAKCLKVLIESNLKLITLDKATSELVDDNGNLILGSGKPKDNSYIYDILGNISLIFKDYNNALIYFSKSYGILPIPSSKSNIGLAHFYKAVKKNTEINYIHQKDIDFNELKQSLQIFDELFNYENDEVREYLRKQISPIYSKCLFLTNNFSKYNSIFYEIKDYYQNEEPELYRLKAISEAVNGNVDKNTFSKLCPEDKEWVYLIGLIKSRNYEEVIYRIEPTIWTEHQDNEKYHLMLLQAYLEVDLDKFVKHFRRYKDFNKASTLIDFTEGLYYERTGDIEKAERILKEISNKESDYVLYLDLISFYERNSLDLKLGALFDDLFNNKRDIIEFEKSNFYLKYFLFLFRNKLLDKAIDLYNELKENIIDELIFMRISAEMHYLAGDFKKSANEFESLFDKTKDLDYLFSGLISFCAYNNLEKAEQLINILIRNNYKSKSTLYAIWSNIEILKDHVDNAFEYAKIAKEIEKDNPISDIHPFYVNRSTRCGKREGFEYLIEYASNFPNHKTWLQAFENDKEDEAGNNIPPKELKNFLNSLNEQFKYLLSIYNERKIGISTFAKIQHRRISELLLLRKSYGIKINITSGSIDEVNAETSHFTDKIIIDAFGLYVLAEIDQIDILKQFSEVHITYSTIESLQLALFDMEDPVIRKVLNFINNSLNAIIVCPYSKSISQIDNELNDMFFKDQIESVIYSFDNSIPYIYSDFTLKLFFEGYNTNFMSIISFFGALNIKGYMNKEKLSNIILNLKSYKYSFMNFDSDDMLYIAKNSNYEIDDNIKLFFNIGKHCDFYSFINVYQKFIRMLKEIISREKLNQYINLYIDLFDKYIRKAQYYFILLEINYKEDSNEIERLYRAKSLVSLLVFKETLSKTLCFSYEFLRIVQIYTFCIIALKQLLSIFKENETDYEYYSKYIARRCMNISKRDIRLAIIYGKKD